MKKEELKNRLEELKESKKIVVGVEQWKDNDKKELVNVWEDEKNNIMQLLGFLYSKTIIKVNNLIIRYSYNYSDLQTISVTQYYVNYDESITKTRYTFYNIPTNCGYLDTYKLNNKE